MYISIFCVPLFQHFFAKLAVNCEVTVLFGFLYRRQDSFPVPPEIAAEPIQIPSCFHCSVVEICLLLLVKWLVEPVMEIPRVLRAALFVSHAYLSEHYRLVEMLVSLFKGADNFVPATEHMFLVPVHTVCNRVVA